MLNMIRNTLIAILILVFITPITAEEKSGLIGQEAPPISLLRLDDNKYFISKELLGKKHLVLCFFATGSVPCGRAIPKLHEIATGLDREDLNFILVNVQEKKNILAPFVQERVYTIPVIMDKYGIVFGKFNGRALPLIVVINMDGLITYYHAGYQDDDELQLVYHLKTH